MSKHEFNAKLEQGIRGGVWITVPFDVQKEFGAKGQVKIKAIIDGHPYRGSLVPMSGKHVLAVLKEIRQSINKDIGDSVHIVLEKDTEPRTIDVPKDFLAELEKNPKAKTVFEKFAFTHKKENVRCIEEAKKAETRLNRINKAIAKITASKRFS